MLKGWWAGKTKARLAAKASGAIGKLSKEIGREAMLPAAVEAWNSYYSYRYWYSYYSIGIGSTVENSCYTSRQNVAPHTRTTWIHHRLSSLRTLPGNFVPDSSRFFSDSCICVRVFHVPS